MATSNNGTTKTHGEGAPDGADRAGATSLDIRQLLRVLTAVKKGDFSVRMPEELTGTAGKVADALNDILELNEKMASALDGISRSVGKEGKIAQRASIGSASGGWAALVRVLST